MTDQATPDFNQALADQLTATLAAERKASDHEQTVKRQRAELDALNLSHATLRDALQRYANTDNCEYGDGPPCPGDPPFVPLCMYCQACAALGEEGL